MSQMLNLTCKDIYKKCQLVKWIYWLSLYHENH